MRIRCRSGMLVGKRAWLKHSRVESNTGFRNIDNVCYVATLNSTRFDLLDFGPAPFREIFTCSPGTTYAHIVNTHVYILYNADTHARYVKSNLRIVDRDRSQTRSPNWTPPVLFRPSIERKTIGNRRKSGRLKVCALKIPVYALPLNRPRNRPIPRRVVTDFDRVTTPRCDTLYRHCAQRYRLRSLRTRRKRERERCDAAVDSASNCRRKPASGYLTRVRKTRE